MSDTAYTLIFIFKYVDSILITSFTMLLGSVRLDYVIMAFS